MSYIDVRPSETDVHMTDVYFSADVETDGSVPGKFSMLSFALVEAGTFDGTSFKRADPNASLFYAELKPISTEFELEALQVNGLDRELLVAKGEEPRSAMDRAYEWVMRVARGRTPVLVAYPLAFDWTWLYWYFTVFSVKGSPFGYSQCYDIKTAYSSKSGAPISLSGRAKLPQRFRSTKTHTHHALDDAREQAEVFANIFEWSKTHGD